MPPLRPNRLRGTPFLNSEGTVTSGNIFWVNSSTGTSGGDGTDPVNSPVNSITNALLLCTASQGDVIYVMPGYTETRTAAITLNVAGVKVVGLGWGAIRPTITIGFAGDGVNITAASTWFENFHFAAPSVDAATAMINVAAANATIKKITGVGSGGSENIVDCITIASGANDLMIDDLRIWNTTVAVNSFISIEAAVARAVIRNVFCFGDCVTSGIIDGATATQITLENVNIGTVGSTIVAAILDSNPTGMVVRCNFAGTSTTLANNAALGTGVRMFDVKVLEETDGSKQGALIPAVDTD